MNTWIFQASPKEYKNVWGVLKNLESNNFLTTWPVNKNAGIMRQEDKVYIWIAGESAGIHAIGQLESMPYVKPNSPNKLDVDLKIEKLLGDNYVKRESFIKNPILKNLPIVTANQGTNFLIKDPKQREEIDKLIESTKSSQATLRVFGEINGFPEGMEFESRKEVSMSGIHKPLQAGISGSGSEGADSIVLSGGYDDQDFGDSIIYTGHGGIDDTGKQIADQEMTKQNLALALSRDNGLPIRVIRGASNQSKFSPLKGYRYDGLYSVEDYWKEDKNEFVVFRFKLVKIPLTQSLPIKLTNELTGQNLGEQTTRRNIQTMRIIRDTKISKEVKNLYDFHCQICDIRIEGPNGPYAEAAHIKSLGTPHNGPDDQDNIICLCPNHHKLFDLHAFTIADDFNLIGMSGKLNIKSGHPVNPIYLLYHRQHYGNKK